MRPDQEDRLVETATKRIRDHAEATDEGVWSSLLVSIWLDVIDVAFEQRRQALLGNLAKAQIDELYSRLRNGTIRRTPIGTRILTDAATLAGAPVEEVFAQARAIAQGHVLPAVTTGEQLAANVVAATIGGAVLKTWVTVGDDKVREAHMAAEGQEVLESEYFNVGGEDLYYPRDPGGSTGNVINCRCTAEHHIAVNAVPV